MGNKQVTYVVVQQGLGNFEKNLAELRSKYNMQITSNMGISQTEAPLQPTDKSSTTVKAVSVIFLVFCKQFKKFCSNKRQFQFSVVSFSSQTRLNDFFNFMKISYCLLLHCSILLYQLLFLGKKLDFHTEICYYFEYLIFKYSIFHRVKELFKSNQTRYGVYHGYLECKTKRIFAKACLGEKFVFQSEISNYSLILFSKI